MKNVGFCSKVMARSSYITTQFQLKGQVIKKPNIMGVFTEFCEASTIHGLSYIASSKSFAKPIWITIVVKVLVLTKTLPYYHTDHPPPTHQQLYIINKTAYASLISTTNTFLESLGQYLSIPTQLGLTSGVMSPPHP